LRLPGADTTGESVRQAIELGGNLLTRGSVYETVKSIVAGDVPQSPEQIAKIQEERCEEL
jgi:hypothetical protein